MPNVNNPRGLVPIRPYNGGADVRLETYYIASGLASTIAYGDPVKSTGTGKQITVCAATDAAVGVFQGCQYVRTDGTPFFSPIWLSGTATSNAAPADALVVDDPRALFEVQTTTMAAGDIGAVADYSTATAANTATGVSGFQLDGATYAATGSKTLKVIDIVRRDDNDFGAYCKAVVLINKHELGSSLTAV